MRTQGVAALVFVLVCGFSRGAEMPSDLGSILREIFNNRAGGGGADNRPGFDNRAGHDNRYHWQPLDQSFFIYMGFIGGNGQLYTLAYPPTRNPGFTDTGFGGGVFGGNGGDRFNPGGRFDWDPAKKRVFGMCAEDLDCQQGHFFCDGENKCQYQQPRDIPCNNVTGCGNSEKYECGAQNTCVLRTDIHVNMNERHNQTTCDCDVMMSESVGRKCNTNIRQCEWVFRACAQNDTCPENFVCKSDGIDGNKSCQFKGSKDGFFGTDEPNGELPGDDISAIFQELLTMLRNIPPTSPGQDNHMYPGQDNHMYPGYDNHMYPGYDNHMYPGHTGGYPGYGGQTGGYPGYGGNTGGQDNHMYPPYTGGNPGHTGGYPWYGGNTGGHDGHMYPGHSGGYPGHSGVYPSQGPNGVYPSHGPGMYPGYGDGMYPSQGPNGVYPSQGPGMYPDGMYPTQGPNGVYPSHGPGMYPGYDNGIYPTQGPYGVHPSQSLNGAQPSQGPDMYHGETPYPPPPGMFPTQTP